MNTTFIIFPSPPATPELHGNVVAFRRTTVQYTIMNRMGNYHWRLECFTGRWNETIYVLYMPLLLLLLLLLLLVLLLLLFPVYLTLVHIYHVDFPRSESWWWVPSKRVSRPGGRKASQHTNIHPSPSFHPSSAGGTRCSGTWTRQPF